jgi:hypothetical protein
MCYVAPIRLLGIASGHQQASDPDITSCHAGCSTFSRAGHGSIHGDVGWGGRGIPLLLGDPTGVSVPMLAREVARPTLRRLKPKRWRASKQTRSLVRLALLFGGRAFALAAQLVNPSPLCFGHRRNEQYLVETHYATRVGNDMHDTSNPL